MLGVVLILMLVNWGVEARKWQVLLKPVQKMSWWWAFKATLAGVSFGINTPNRIGEYGGRILFVREGSRLKALSLAAIGGLSQFLVTLIAGCGGLIFLLNVSATATPLIEGRSYQGWVWALLSSVIAVSVIGLLLFFRLGWFVRLIEKVPVIAKLSDYLSVLEHLSTVILLRILSLSVIRYLVFAFQYIFMLHLMQVDISVWQTFWLISVMFLVLAFLPTMALAEVGLRGKLSIELFGLFSVNSIGILAAAVGIWAINLIIPALLGSLLILRIKIFKK